MVHLQRIGLIPERIWPLEVGNWSFQTGLKDEAPEREHPAEGLSGTPPPNNLPMRLFLIGLAIGIQGYDNISLDWIQGLIGLPAAAALSFLCLVLSLACLCLAVSPRLPHQLARRPGLIIGRITVVVCFLLGIIGLGVVGVDCIVASQTPGYYNDGTLLDQNAALMLLHGQNPYTQSDIVAATRDFHQSAEYTTPLQQGKLAHQQDYPTSEQLKILLAQEPLGHPNQVLEFESHVSYPALAFLTLVPLVWAGAAKVALFYILCLALLVIIGLRFVRPNLRWWIVLLLLADLPLINSTLDGALDALYILLIFLAWLSYRRWWLSAALLGLALASKQLAWLYAPFYLIFIYQRCGFQNAVWRLAIASFLFAMINLPFIVWNPGAWVAGVLAPMNDPMFPEGVGVIVLSVGKLLPFLPRTSYSVLEGLGLLAALIWYWKWGRERPEAAMILAVLPLSLAWRSLPSYFEYGALPAALLLAHSAGFHMSEVKKTLGKLPARLYHITSEKGASHSKSSVLSFRHAEAG